MGSSCPIGQGVEVAGVGVVVAGFGEGGELGGDGGAFCFEFGEPGDDAGAHGGDGGGVGVEAGEGFDFASVGVFGGVEILILIADSSAHPPGLTKPAEDTEGGRGLMLVEAVSKRWGWFCAAADANEGKFVWALCET
jgi:hypothetical protein